MRVLGTIATLNILITSLCFVACAPKVAEDPNAGLEAYQKAGGKLKNMETLLAENNATVTIEQQSRITKEEDLVWAPEDEDAPMPSGLDEVWKAPEKKTWYESYTEASREARSSGKPMLIWFTNSSKSPLCKNLNDDLFSNSGFNTWATKRIVRMRVDDTITGKKEGLDIGSFNDLITRKRQYVDKIKKRYKVMGHPTVLILSPRGAVIKKIRGYKKNSADYYWGRIKQAVDTAENDYGAWREKMEKRGYRMWTNRDGVKTFAKLSKYHPKKILLVDPDGNRGKTSFLNLSDADQAWIMLQKKRHEAQRSR